MGMTIVLVVTGALLLANGRRLFWLFVGVLGFAAGIQMATLYAASQPFWVLWTVGLVCGIIGTLLALFFQHVAIAVGGFVAGGSIALHLMAQLGQHAGGMALFIGGAAGAVAMILIFDWALIVLSAGVGAGFIFEAVGWRVPFAPIAYLALVAVGVLFQSRLLLASRKDGA